MVEDLRITYTIVNFFFLFVYIYEKKHERLCDVRCIEDLFISKHNINVVITETSVDKKKKKELEENESPFRLPRRHRFFFSLFLSIGTCIWSICMVVVLFT